MRLELVRYCYAPKHVLGLLKFPVLDDGSHDFQLWTVECPWQMNRRFVSCIPDGMYEVEAHDSIKHPETYRILGAPNRSGILIHVGNSTDDITGCVAVGLQTDDNSKVWNSRDAMRLLNDALGRVQSHSLVIGPGLGATLPSREAANDSTGGDNGNGVRDGVPPIG